MYGGSIEIIAISQTYTILVTILFSLYLSAK
jgi:hypothetical protein